LGREPEGGRRWAEGPLRKVPPPPAGRPAARRGPERVGNGAETTQPGPDGRDPAGREDGPGSGETADPAGASPSSRCEEAGRAAGRAPSRMPPPREG